MIYQYRVFLDQGYDGVDWEVLYSHKKIEKKEFKKIVKEAYRDENREEDPYVGTCGSIVEHIIKTNPHFFDLEMGGGATIGDYEDDGDGFVIVIFGTHVGSFDELVEAVKTELSENDYHDEEGNLPTIKDIDDLSDFVECHESLDDDEWEQFEKLLDEAKNFDGIDIIDEGQGGGAFNSEADYWRYRMDPNY